MIVIKAMTIMNIEMYMYTVLTLGERGPVLRVQRMALHERVQQHLRRHVAPLALLHVAE